MSKEQKMKFKVKVYQWRKSGDRRVKDGFDLIAFVILVEKRKQAERDLELATYFLHLAMESGSNVVDLFC